MTETVNINIIFQSIIEIIYTILGLDKINNDPIEFTKLTNSKNIDNNTDKFTLRDLLNHIMKSYNEFMGVEGLTNNKSLSKNVDSKTNEKYTNINSKKKVNLPSWAKTSN